MRPLLVIGCPAVLLPLQEVILVGNIQGRQHRQPHRVNRIGSLCHGPHFCVDVLRQLQNVFRIRPPQVIRLIEDLHPHTAGLRILQCRIFCCRRHNRRAPESNSPAPPRSTQSAPAFSPRHRDSLPALFSTAPPPAATRPTVRPALPLAGARVARRAPPPSGP